MSLYWKKKLDTVATVHHHFIGHVAVVGKNLTERKSIYVTTVNKLTKRRKHEV
jgi:hypothetical protein